MLKIKSQIHDYTVEKFDDLQSILDSLNHQHETFYLIDRSIQYHFGSILEDKIDSHRTILIDASEEEKSFERLQPVMLELLKQGIKRNARLVVIGGGVLQDIGCFISSVLFRGIRWELIPTTLLAQADSCIGSKSSINIASYKNQIGTFYPPHRVLLTSSVLSTLPWDEIRSGLGEVIKLQLIQGKTDFEELINDLNGLSKENQSEILSKWVSRSMAVKKPYIESDEYDRNIRNILNYGHTFGHAYESATHYAIPHGIAVVLGILTATYLSSRLNLESHASYQHLKKLLFPWLTPYEGELIRSDREIIFKAIKHDKKNTGDSINCILTRGPGKMAKTKVNFEDEIKPAINDFITLELTA
jgi:3-dehydroquinate synthase